MTERIYDLDDPAFGRLFTDLQHSWFRLETLQRYDVAYEKEEFDAFLLRGEQPGTEPGPWQEMIRSHAAAGRKLSRVHVVIEPPTAYVRYELAAYRANAEAGEDIRVIPVLSGNWPEGVPYTDFWLFDDRDLWLMHYGQDGDFLYTERRAAPEELEKAIRWRGFALRQSIPLSDYVARLAA